MYFPSTCFAGRIVLREDRLGGLDWTHACPIPPEDCIPLNPPMFFCPQHYQVAADLLYEVFDRAGEIDHSIVGGPVPPLDEFDQIVGELVLGERE